MRIEFFILLFIVTLMVIALKRRRLDKEIGSQKSEVGRLRHD